MDKNNITKATLGRLPMYLKYLESLPQEENSYISAPKIARALELGDVQVRKDLGCVSRTGKPKLGFKTDELIESLKKHLRTNKTVTAVVVGAGKLGRALAAFEGFSQYGVEIIASFDKREVIVDDDQTITVLPMSKFESFCRDNNVQIGIITIDEESTQQICNQMIQAGITAIWNFTPYPLKTPEGILCKNENLALSLAHLSNQLFIINQENTHGNT